MKGSCRQSHCVTDGRSIKSHQRSEMRKPADTRNLPRWQSPGAAAAAHVLKARVGDATCGRKAATNRVPIGTYVRKDTNESLHELSRHTRIENLQVQHMHKPEQRLDKCESEEPVCEMPKHSTRA